MRNALELEEAFIDNFKYAFNNINIVLLTKYFRITIKGIEILWIDKIVSLGGLEWTLEHISFLYNKLKYAHQGKYILFNNYFYSVNN